MGRDVVQTQNTAASNGSSRVLIVDDDEVTRSVLSAMLEESQYEPVEAADFEQVKTALRSGSFPLVLVDLVFADHDYGGFDIIQYIQAIHENSDIVIITSHPSADTAIEALRIKATDYLTKPIRKDDLINTVETILSPMKLPEPESELLSIREREVLYMLYKGLSYREMAETLSCSVATAKTYGRRIYRKLGVSTRAEAVYEALHLNLVGN